MWESEWEGQQVFALSGKEAIWHLGDLAPMYLGLKEVEALVPEEIRVTHRLFENATSVHFKVANF